jgi:hypothetical protein
VSRQVQITFDARDPASLGSFWARALGYVEDPPPAGFDSWPAALEAWNVPEEHRNDAYAVVDPDGSQRIFFQRVPEPKTAKNRVHLDVRVSDRSRPVEEQEAAIQAEVERLEQQGATRQDWVADMGKHFMVMLDPEGNEFCLT